MLLNAMCCGKSSPQRPPKTQNPDARRRPSGNRLPTQPPALTAPSRQPHSPHVALMDAFSSRSLLRVWSLDPPAAHRRVLGRRHIAEHLARSGAPLPPFRRSWGSALPLGLPECPQVLPRLPFPLRSPLQEKVPPSASSPGEKNQGVRTLFNKSRASLGARAWPVWAC